MSWESVRLGDIATFSNGVNFGKEAYGAGVKLIGVSDFGDRYYPDYSTLSEVNPDVVRDKALLKPGDIVFVRSNGNKALVGRCMLLTDECESVTFSGFCIRARLNDTNRWNPRFLTYYFKSDEFRKSISSSTAGTNIQNLNQGILSSHVALLPEYETQCRIAGILDQYNDLIENNRRQIALLEEAAQRLYREWFVDLHFPGHDSTELNSGVPSGWKRLKLGEFAPFKRGKVITAKQAKPGAIPVVAGGLEPAYYHAEANTSGPVVTVSGSGANAGFTRLYLCDVWASDCSYADADTNENVLFVYLSAKLLGRGFRYLQRGSAQPHVYPTHINDLDLLVPSREVLDQFNCIVTKQYEAIRIAEQSIDAAREARDRLLPKLMTGEIAV